MPTIQQFPSWFSKQKLSGKVAIGCAGLFVLCCLFIIPIAILSPSTPTLEITNTAVAEVSSMPVATQTEKPTEILSPTNIPEQAPTPVIPTPQIATSSLSESKETARIAGLDCQIQAKTRQELAENCQIWQSDEA
jgi:hypothetical protein